MKNIATITAAAILSLAGSVSAIAADNLALSNAGLSLSGIEIPSPKTPKNNQWMTLRKITVNTAQPDRDDILVGLVERGEDIDKVIKELTEGGFKAKALQNNSGGYMVIVDVAGLDAADYAVGLARYYYITEVKVGQKVHNQLFSLNNKARSAYAVKLGAIKGAINNGPVDLKLNKLEWTIKGGINNAPVDLSINHEQGVITGGANASIVALKFNWSTEEVTVLGNSGHSLLRYTVNWKNGLLEGHYNHSPVKVEFNMNEGSVDGAIVSVKGYANQAPVELTYNKVSGHIGGVMNRGQVDVNLVNCDLYDFLQHFFLFLK